MRLETLSYADDCSVNNVGLSSLLVLVHVEAQEPISAKVRTTCSDLPKSSLIKLSSHNCVDDPIELFTREEQHLIGLKTSQRVLNGSQDYFENIKSIYQSYQIFCSMLSVLLLYCLSIN